MPLDAGDGAGSGMDAMMLDAMPPETVWLKRRSRRDGRRSADAHGSHGVDADRRSA
jgi:hypothetical protein